MRLLSALCAPVDRWAVSSQQTARRNAMIATNALASRRRESDQVHAYLAETLSVRRREPHAEPLRHATAR